MNKEIVKILYSCADKAYKDFQSKLIPCIDCHVFIGVRTPVLRKIAKDMVKSGTYKDFISKLPHKYFEENQLHAFVLSEIRDFNVVIDEIGRFLPYVDNWATCDQLSPLGFKKNSDKLLTYIQKWIKSKHVYTVRFGVLCLMRYFMDDKFDIKYVDIVADIKSKEYYINMMRAWYFATCAAKHFDEILPYFRDGKIDDWTCSRAIQKAIESYRVIPEHKVRLRQIKGK